jgi:hypothetical protein
LRRDELVVDVGGSEDTGDRLLRAIAATPAVASVRELEAGTVLDGQYRVERVIGRGGMAVVYLARDLRLGRDVALKIGSAAASSAVVRADLEARALAKLSHPNIVTMFQVGDSDGSPYIAMEYVGGGTAREWLRARVRTWREIVALYAAAGDGLAAAHAAGFVHRDFKPDNVLVGADGRPRVADFGLVHGPVAGRDAAEPAPGVTLSGTRLGTPAYMAPEQIACKEVDARTDQYAFCASLWEALLARRPYEGSMPTEIARAMEAYPPSVPRRTDVPGWVLVALRRGLARERDARWPTLGHLLAALRRDRRPRLRHGIAAGVAIAIVGGGAALLVPHDRSPVAAPACAAIAAAGELYVDAAAAPGGTGAAACPVRTISDALAIPERGPRTIHVASGRYDRDHGERFPLIVRGGVSIVGAGAEATRVVGTGMLDHRAEGGVFDAQLTATFVVGDARAPVSIANMAIEAETPTPELGRRGIVCDRGNLAAFDGPIPAANTHLVGLSIGPGFDNAVIVGSSSDPALTGCNLALTRSVVHGSIGGVWVLGCAVGRGTVAVRAELGDGTVAGGNAFRSLGTPQIPGIGVNVWDCAREVVIDHDTFEGMDGGAAIVQHAPPVGHFVVEHDQFVKLFRFGLTVSRAAIIDRLDDNSFAWNHAAARSASERAVGLVLDGETEPAPAYPRILHARRNTFVDNDVAVELRGRAIAVSGTTPIVDFGRPDDPGGNTFACNATEHGASAPGFDLGITAPSDGTGTLLLAGNVWDHAPPHVARGAAGNGADVALPLGHSPAVVTSHSVARDVQYCRDPGP